MIIENRALWLARSFASSLYNHVTAQWLYSFQNGSQICRCFGVGNRSIILFSQININVIILKQLVAWGDLIVNCLRFRKNLKYDNKYLADKKEYKHSSDVKSMLMF